MKFDLNKKMESFLETFTNNIKWGIAFSIRALSILGVIILILFILKWIGLIKDFKGFLVEVGVMEIKADKPTQISKPTTPTHKTDLQDIEDIKDLIKKRLEEMRKKEKNEN